MCVTSNQNCSRRASTSFQQPNAHGGDLDDVLVLADVAGENCGSLRGETTGVQLHDLLAGLEDLHVEETLFQFTLQTLS